MQYGFSPDDLLARIGIESMKVAAAERQLDILELALRMAVGNLEVGAEGISAEMFAAASAELERVKLPTDDG